MTCLRSTFVLKVFSIGESGKRINMEEIETLRAALARANKLIDEQANKSFGSTRKSAGTPGPAASREKSVRWCHETRMAQNLSQ
jgi:hypothetical protein